MRSARPIRATGKVRPAFADLLCAFFLEPPPRPPFTMMCVCVCQKGGRVPAPTRIGGLGVKEEFYALSVCVRCVSSWYRIKNTHSLPGTTLGTGLARTGTKKIAPCFLSFFFRNECKKPSSPKARDAVELHRAAQRQRERGPLARHRTAQPSPSGSCVAALLRPQEDALLRERGVEGAARRPRREQCREGGGLSRNR